MVIIFAFLRNVRSTMVVALAIPTAAMCVFIGMYVARELFGSTITLNMVSMMGLMLAVGMLVDPAVVVLESIFRRRQEDGLGSHQAALIGSREVGMAVLASSLTTICVFVPFFFLSDSRSAAWMRDAGVAICLAVIVSMIVALSLIPLASSRLFRDGVERYDAYLKMLILSGIGAIIYWRAGDVGWEGVAVWWNEWTVMIADSFISMEWTTAVVLAVTVLVVGLLVWFSRRRGLYRSFRWLLLGYLETALNATMLI